MPKIQDVRAREVLDSRGNPTVEADVITDEGLLGRAAVPSGASTGSREALELRDGDKARFAGKGVRKAVKNVSEIIRAALVNMDVADQAALDRRMLQLDRTPNKSLLGANAILAASMAAAKAGAAARGIPLHASFGPERLLPCPFMNIVNGGAHADNNLDFQEFMIVPGGFPSFTEALRAGVETFHRLKEILKARKLSTAVGDEGGFAPHLTSVEETLELLLSAIESAGYKPGKEIALALDVAASEFGRQGAYDLQRAGSRETSETLVGRYEKLCEAYPIVSIEDGLSEDDAAGWNLVTTKLGSKVQLVGDDLFATNPEIFRKGIEEKMATAILIKLNQVGTVTETLETIRMAHEAGYGAMVSHRSGETEDTTIAHLAVGTGAGMIKTGSVTRSDRTAKYNELLRLEESLGNPAPYAGFSKISFRG